MPREQTELERLVRVDDIARAMDGHKAEIEALLLDWRESLIEEAVADLEDLDATSYHLLSIGESLELAALIILLARAHVAGRNLVRGELERQGARVKPKDKTYPQSIELLAAVTASRLINDVASRAAGAAIGLALIEPDEEELIPRAERELREGSTGYVSLAAAAVVHVALAQGRAEEAEAQKELIERVVYSCVLDSNSCEACADADGESGATEDDITPAPNPNCAGGDACRCCHLYVTL